MHIIVTSKGQRTQRKTEDNGRDNVYRKHIVKPAVRNMTSHIALNLTTVNPNKVVNTEQDSDVLILKRYLLVEFMATPKKREGEPIYNTANEIVGFRSPPATPTKNEIIEFCQKADIPVEHWTRWLRQRSFQDEVAGTSKDSIYSGAGATAAYIALEDALTNPHTSNAERAKIAATIAKLHLKHLEIMAKMRIAQTRGSQTETAKNTLEQILAELKQNKVPKPIEMVDVTEYAQEAGSHVKEPEQ